MPNRHANILAVAEAAWGSPVGNVCLGAAYAIWIIWPCRRPLILAPACTGSWCLSGILLQERCCAATAAWVMLPMLRANKLAMSHTSLMSCKSTAFSQCWSAPTTVGIILPRCLGFILAVVLAFTLRFLCFLQEGRSATTAVGIILPSTLGLILAVTCAISLGVLGQKHRLASLAVRVCSAKLPHQHTGSSWHRLGQSCWQFSLGCSLRNLDHMATWQAPHTGTSLHRVLVSEHSTPPKVIRCSHGSLGHGSKAQGQRTCNGQHKLLQKPWSPMSLRKVPPSGNST